METLCCLRLGVKEEGIGVRSRSLIRGKIRGREEERIRGFNRAIGVSVREGFDYIVPPSNCWKIRLSIFSITRFVFVDRKLDTGGPRGVSGIFDVLLRISIRAIKTSLLIQFIT